MVEVKSALYEGSVDHLRPTSVRHGFRGPLFMVYLDLSELPELFDGFPGWTVNRPGLGRFDRGDHFGDASIRLEDVVRERGFKTELIGNAQIVLKKSRLLR